MRRSIRILASALLLGVGACATAAQNGLPAAYSRFDVSDDALVRELPGFQRGFSDVNGVRLHHVAGGAGEPVILLPGWPETWWSYNRIMPALAARYRVIAVDIRGMGASSKPEGGYDKKTMARDIYELVRHLGLQRAHIVGHDIGAQVAFAYAANHPEAAQTLTLLDVPHPDEDLLTWPLLPAHGTFGDKLDPAHPYVWWFAFHQVRGLPEAMLEGRHYIEQEWFFRYLMLDESKIDARDRAVYARAYDTRDAIRAGNAWYQAFTQDIIDARSYGRIRTPAFGIAGPGYGWLLAFYERRTTGGRVVQLPRSGHFVAEEAPEDTTRLLLEFLTQHPGAG